MDRPAHRPITPRPARGLRADDVSCGQWRATAHRGPAWRDRASPSRPSPLAQFELRAALIGRRPRRLFLAGYLRHGPPRAGGVGAGRCAAERLSAPAAGPREPVPSSSQSRPRHPGRSPIFLALVTQARPGYPVRIASPRSPTPDPGQAAPCTAAGRGEPGGSLTPARPCPPLPGLTPSSLLQPRAVQLSSVPAVLRPLSLLLRPRDAQPL